MGGAFVAWRYHQLGLTLSHYDARGHLVVARRIFDSITPGWQQIGAVWLPLPHLLNAIPVQMDFFYRTGASAVAISIASFAIAAVSIAWIVPLLTGLTTLAAALLIDWCQRAQRGPRDAPTPPVARVGVAFALACLSRYEA